MSNIDVATAMFDAHLAQNAPAASALLTDDFRFASPQDDHIDKTTWLEKCFPTIEHFADFEMLEIVNGNPTTVFVRYRYRLADDSEFTNMESLVIRDNKVAEVSVHFGGALRT
jgi:hypothetical protein